MKIQIWQSDVCLKVRFKHASKTRKQADSVFAKLELDSITAYAECLPRDYVTNETVESVIKEANNLVGDCKTLDALKQKLKSAIELNAIGSYTRNNTNNKIGNNSIALIDMLIIDFELKQNGQSFFKHFNLKQTHNKIRSTAVITGGSITKSLLATLIFRIKNYQDIKLKISGRLFKDKVKLALIKMIMPKSCKIRVDANNHWNNPEQAINYLKALPKVWAVEEPLNVNDYQGMSKISTELGLSIILDESFHDIAHFKQACQYPGKWIPNVRISKVAGISNCLAILDWLHEHNQPFILGSHVGETNLSTFYELCLAGAYAKNCVGFEGGYSYLILSNDPFLPVIAPNKNGFYEIDQLTKIPSID